NNGSFHNITLAVELSLFFTFGDYRSYPCLSEEGRNPRAARAQFFCERPLRGELQLKLTRQVLAFELFVLPNIGSDHFLDLARFQQLSEAKAIHAGVVAHASEVLYARIAQCGD